MISYFTLTIAILTLFHPSNHGMLVNGYGVYDPGFYETISGGVIYCGPGSYYIAEDPIGTGDHLTKSTQVIGDIWDIHTAQGYISAMEWDQDIQLFNDILMWQYIAETKSLWIHFRKFLSENLDGDTGKSIDTLASWDMIKGCESKPGDSAIHYRASKTIMPPTYFVGYYENHAHDHDGLKNEYHYGQITTASANDTNQDGKTYTFTNGAGLSWALIMERGVYGEGSYLFRVGEECPYFKDGYTWAIMARDENGEYYLSGPDYEMFTLKSGHVQPSHWTSYSFENPIISHLPLFYVGGWYENRQYHEEDHTKNSYHYVHIAPANIDSPDGLTYTWSNAAGVSWTITIDVIASNSEKIVFHVGEDCVYFADGYVTAILTSNDSYDYMYITGPSEEKYDLVSTGANKPSAWGDEGDAYGVYTQSDDENHLRA